MPHTFRRVRLALANLALMCGGGAFAADGAAVYATYCASCHQVDGSGLAGVFPPLAGHAADLHAAEGGRRYLVDAVVFGVQGPITVAGVEYDGVMPSWFQLSDEDIAAVLNHVMQAWETDDAAVAFEPFVPDEVATSRRGALSAQGVWQRRPDLGNEEAVDAVDLPDATFTMAQVERAHGVYGRLCAECHGDSFTGGLIGGPPLAGTIFLDRWGGRSVESLFTYTKTQMPQGGPNSLPAQQYADLIALILHANGHEAGEVELPGDPEVLRSVGVRSP